ncbi:unnamed protein product [Bursaphelenchus okinawaensis]|uniref:Mos1 transposase HTH domain-containing protein n=1 Tax=Bursaphelenchus okinawaensis TaxID=465554 RepID=A0A811JSB0_9BILA|nr:unnamed protein product [Bursaphelenchus okinawaensis]CAG9080693.1 unnamed protein product [Bursaphelenchus okinawaensis]
MDRKHFMRLCLLYEFKQGTSATVAHREILQVFGSDAYSRSQCEKWFKRFKNGDESLSDQEHGKRPGVVDNELLRVAIDENPRQTTVELAKHFGCSYATISRRLNVIGKVNHGGKWVDRKDNGANTT